jgi:hypothetical protein
MAEPRDLSDLIVATARQKAAAAQARLNPDPLAEKPRDAILAGLRLVADTLAGDGYTLVPSSPKLARKHGDLTLQFNIQSDRNNIAGHRAAIWVHPAVYSRSFTAWSRNHDSEWIRPNASFPLAFFGAQIGDFCQPRGWMEWDFADAATRDVVADDLVRTIRDNVFPVFATFDGPMEGIAALADRDWPPPDRLLGYLLSQGQGEVAEKALNRYLATRPKVEAQFHLLLRKFAAEGLPAFRDLGAADLAAFALATGYPWRRSLV